MAKLEHVCVKSSTPSSAHISLPTAHTLPTEERCCAAAPCVKCMFVGGEEGKSTCAEVKSGRALYVVVIPCLGTWLQACFCPTQCHLHEPTLSNADQPPTPPGHVLPSCLSVPMGLLVLSLTLLLGFWASPLLNHPQSQGVDEKLLKRAVPSEKGLGGGGGCPCTWGPLIYGATVPQVPGAGRRGGQWSGGQASGCLRASSRWEVGSAGRRLCVRSRSCPGTCPTPGWGLCLPGGSSRCAETPRGVSTAVVAGAVSC